MDPKAPANLDPKLKEVYDRVMGTGSTGSTPAPISPVTPATTPAANPMPVTPAPNPSPMSSMTSTQPLTPPLAKPITPTLPPLPQAPGPSATSSMQPPSAPSNPSSQQTVDYAALAAKYATPLPSFDTNTPPPRPASVTPSTTTYGVVNSGATEKSPAGKAEKKSGGKKKLLLIIGIPLLLIAYTVIWIFVFHIDINNLIPLPK